MHGIRIGRIFGVDIRVNASWAFVALLLTWNLVAVFSHWHPGWPPFVSIVVAASAALVFFGCVLLHELAHALVALGYGMRVRSITLFLFGGVANIDREPPSATAEFLMAIAGPITSIALGIGALVVASLITPVSLTGVDVTDPHAAWNVLSQFGPLTTLLMWLGPANVVIGVFNLVPGFPLDGGRVLRSILWAATGDLRSATRWASATGQAIGWMFIVAGIGMAFGARLPFFGTGLGSGLWLAFIGWFLLSAAAQTTARLALDDALAGMTVAQLMQRDILAVGPDLSLDALVREHFVQGEARTLPVVGDDGAFLGLISLSDVRNVPPGAWDTTTVSAIMHAPQLLAVTTPDVPLANAFEELAREDVSQLPVVVGGRLVGMLRRRDVTRWLELAWKPGYASGPHDTGHRHRHA
jgi:Zn-dependent protease/CBS domain-containing protein